MPDIPSASSPAPLLSANTTPSIPRETAQSTATQPSSEASSSHFLGLRRRPKRQGDIESGAPPADDRAVGFSSAVAPKLQQALVSAYGSNKQHPITTTGTVLGYQAWNQLSAGGPPGEMPKAPKLPPLETDRFRFSVPASKPEQLKLAAQLLDTPALDKWMPAPQSAPGAPGSASPLPSILGASAQAVATASTVALQSVGIMARPTARLTDMASPEARAAAASRPPMLDARIGEQKAFIELAGAQYAARGIEIEVDKAVQCLQAAAGDQGAQVEAFAKGVKPLLTALRRLPADAPPERREELEGALRRQGAAIIDLPPEVQTPLHQAMAKLDAAVMAEAQATQRHAAAQERLADLQYQRMSTLIDQARAVHAPLGDALRTVADRLGARPAKGDQLPRDTVLENVFNAGILAFAPRAATGPLSLGEEQATQLKHALQTLGALDAGGLATITAAPTERSPAQSAAVALAREVAVLPRGVEMLSALLAPPQAGAPALDLETSDRRVAALRVLFTADAALQASGGELPQLARSAAAQALQTSDFKLDGLAPELRHAFNAVRNEFFEKGPGTPLQQADDYLKGLTTDMLSSVSREHSVMGVIARALPVGGATALNPSAIASATRTLAQAGLITSTPAAVDAMRDGIETLRGGDDALPAERALKTLARALDVAVPKETPEHLLSATVAAVQVPVRFGLDDRTLQAHPKLAGLWERYAEGQIKPAEAVHQLARVAAADLTAAGEPDAAKTVGAFRKTLDGAVGSAIWNRGQIDNKEQLLDGLISIARLMSVRDRFKFSGGNSYGFDTSRVQMGMKPGDFPDPLSLTMRVAAAGKYQHDLVMEIGMTTAAYYLTAGTQSTVGAKMGFGAGVSAKVDVGAASFGARLADLTAAASYENQWQNGLQVRVPQDVPTQPRNQLEFEDMLRHAVMWEEMGHAGPVDAILKNVDVASLNLLGKYNREAVRGELSGTALSPQITISRPLDGTPAAAPSASETAPAPAPAAAGKKMAQVVQGRVALAQGRTVGELRHAMADEASGYYRYPEERSGARTLQQSGAAASLSVNLKRFEDGKTINAADVAGASRMGDHLGGTEVTKRLVTVDGVTAPMRTRRITEFVDLPRFEQAIESDRARWINHGNTYTKFPDGFKQPAEDFRLRQQSSESDLRQIFQDAGKLDNQFKQYLAVDCMQVPAAAIVDGYDASAVLARKLGRPEEAAAIHAEREAFLAEDSSWQPRRMAINNVFNTANQPGVTLLGLEVRVADNSEGAHNDVLFPRG
ncbi:hypothetical protein CS062_18250 [Roseateles chitinivorans]|uniref:Uncharacterized protein n=1 Tax=Roseateles chitinivorans TaxID=2917965 RepID=A0A2G9C5S0_9BURK|nr:hypothetical protein [Roseateles chitinivorans]PIM51766.1 hypothetical protein CS062_18250 [Roseateles chitinivorans]